VDIGGDGDGPPVLSAEELEEIRQQVLSNVIQSMQAADASQKAGFVPAGVRRLVNDLLEPKMDWRTMIDCHVRSQLKNDYTLTRLSRVDVGEFIFPAEDDDLMAEADIWIDTSGSMGPELLREILSEIKGIMQTFGEFKLRVGCFDAKAYEVTEFTERNIDDIDNYEMQGGGGTLFGSFWNAMADEGRVPERMICFTDGYPCDSWGDGFENYCDTLWVVHGGSRTKAPFGLTVFYEDAEKA
jgi:predicted metal-dependent peptidase